MSKNNYVGDSDINKPNAQGDILNAAPRYWTSW